MKDIKSMTLAELGTELKALGEPAFRAKQIYRWMHRGVRDFSEFNYSLQGTVERMDVAIRDLVTALRALNRGIEKGGRQ